MKDFILFLLYFICGKIVGIGSTNFVRITFDINSLNIVITAYYKPISSNINNFIQELSELRTNEKFDKQNIEIFTDPEEILSQMSILTYQTNSIILNMLIYP